MTRILAFAMTLVAGSAFAQTPRPRPTEPPSNEQVGISIDRYIGDASTSPSRVSHDVMFTRSIFRSGNPLEPGEPAPSCATRRMSC